MFHSHGCSRLANFRERRERLWTVRSKVWKRLLQIVSNPCKVGHSVEADDPDTSDGHVSLQERETIFAAKVTMLELNQERVEWKHGNSSERVYGWIGTLEGNDQNATSLHGDATYDRYLAIKCYEPIQTAVDREQGHPFTDKPLDVS